MQKHHICYFTVLVFLVSISFSSFIFTLDNPAFADHKTANVSTPQGTSVPGCEETNECFVPYEVTVDVGGVVTWSNDDSAVHTVTAGSTADGPSGVFDSSLFMSGTTFSHTFLSAGEFPYFCMVHPWMVGIVTVLSKESPNTQSSIKISGTTQSVSYTISGDSLSKITPDVDANSLIIKIDAFNGGQLTITLPRELIDATIGEEDDDYFVLVDGEEVDFDETTTSIDRTLVISFPPGANEIVIIGTSLPSLESKDPICGAGTELINGICQKIEENQNPIIDYTITPEVIHVGDSVKFDGSDSYDSDGRIVKYEWWFGDGTSGTGKTISHKYSSQGERTAVLEITDDDNAKVKKEFPIKVLKYSNGNQSWSDWIWIAVVIGIAGGAVFAISRSRKSSKPRTITTTISEPSSAQNGRECDVCSTTIPEGQNVCPNCGDTYSVKK